MKTHDTRFIIGSTVTTRRKHSHLNYNLYTQLCIESVITAYSPDLRDSYYKYFQETDIVYSYQNNFYISTRLQ